MLRVLVVLSLLSGCLSYRVHADDRKPVEWVAVSALETLVFTGCAVGVIYEEKDEDIQSWPLWKTAAVCAAGTLAIDTVVMLAIYLFGGVVDTHNEQTMND